jgi:phage terminase large subunit-like protein
LHVIPFHFFPSKQESKKVRANGVDLTPWIEEEYIIEHEERIDYDDIYNRIMEIFTLFEVQMLGYDPYSAHDLIARIKANIDIAHILIEAVSQNITTMSPPSKYLEELIMTQRINMGVNPVLAYCNSNSRVKYSVSSNLIRVIKDPQLNPIDSMISTIVALACFMETEFDELKHM